MLTWSKTRSVAMMPAVGGGGGGGGGGDTGGGGDEPPPELLPQPLATSATARKRIETMRLMPTEITSPERD
jgi:hypothetical protein